jgi:hypothetical protein
MAEFFREVVLFWILAFLLGIGCAAILTEAKTPTCPQTEFINQSGEDWNATDRQVFKTTKEGCMRNYHTECVAKFIKISYNNYHVTCVESLNGSNPLDSAE